MEIIRISQSELIEYYNMNGSSETLKKFGIQPAQLYSILKKNGVPLKRPKAAMSKKIILEE